MLSSSINFSNQASIEFKKSHASLIGSQLSIMNAFFWISVSFPPDTDDASISEKIVFVTLGQSKLHVDAKLLISMYDTNFTDLGAPALNEFWTMYGTYRFTSFSSYWTLLKIIFTIKMLTSKKICYLLIGVDLLRSVLLYRHAWIRWNC